MLCGSVGTDVHGPDEVQTLAPRGIVVWGQEGTTRQAQTPSWIAAWDQALAAMPCAWPEGRPCRGFLQFTTLLLLDHYQPELPSHSIRL